MNNTLRILNITRSRYMLIQRRKIRASERGGWDVKHPQSRQLARLVARIQQLSRGAKPASRRKSEPLRAKLVGFGE